MLTHCLEGPEEIIRNQNKGPSLTSCLVNAEAFLHIQKGNGTGGEAIRKCHTGQQGQVKLLGETTDINRPSNIQSSVTPCHSLVARYVSCC